MGSERQWVQRDSEFRGTQGQWNNGFRGTEGKRNNGFRGTEGQWAERDSG